jgi:hypothetical protein
MRYFFAKPYVSYSRSKLRPARQGAKHKAPSIAVPQNSTI